MRKNGSHPKNSVQYLPNNITIVSTQMGDILVNCPPETLKFLLANSVPIPKIILLPPDIPIGKRLGSSGFVYQGINYASVEFLLYANYFINGQHKTTLITVTDHQSARLKKILQETFIGPSNIEAYYPYPWILKECRALSHYEAIGRSVELDDLVEFISLESSQGQIGPALQISLEDDHFHFFEQDKKIAEVSTEIDGSAMPLTLAPPQPVLRQEISLQFIGGSDGFDPEGITTCFLAYFGSASNDKATLFDAAAYLRVRLGNLGISPAQISEVFISHLHEDHIAGLPELILGEHRIRVITSQLIYKGLLCVLSAMLAVSEEEVASLFDYFPLQPGKPILIDGKQFDAIYAIHTIPTLAVRVNGLCYSGDMRYDEEWFDQLADKGILNPARKQELIKFAEASDILVQDAGGGEIHTTPSPEILKALAAKSKRIILTHARKEKQKLPGSKKLWPNIEFAVNGHVTAFGGIIHTEQGIENLITISACPLYARLSISRRIALANQILLKILDPGEQILIQGEESDGKAYIVHKGLVKAFVDDKLVQVLGRGNSIGERGALTGENRTATIQALDQTQILELPIPVFKSIAKKLGLTEVYERVDWLWKHSIFQHLPWATLLDLALDFQPMRLPTGRLLFEYGTPGNECFLLVSGEITLFDKNLDSIGTFANSGEFFGGRAVLFGSARNTYACISKDAEIWALPASALQRLQLLYPSIILHLRTVENQRHGQTPLLSAFDI